MPFDKESRYMSKIHVILVIFLFFFFLNGVNFESNFFPNKKYTDLSFRIYHYTQTKYSKEGKNKKLIEEFFIKLILNIVNIFV